MTHFKIVFGIIYRQVFTVFSYVIQMTLVSFARYKFVAIYLEILLKLKLFFHLLITRGARFNILFLNNYLLCHSDHYRTYVNDAFEKDTYYIKLKRIMYFG